MDAVIFQIGSQRCAVELRLVEQVIPLGPITPVPGAPAAVVGAMNVGGHVVAVLDPHRLMGGGGSPPPGGLGLLVEARGCRAVLRVDRVEGVVAPNEAEEASPSHPAPVAQPLDLDARLQELLLQVDAGQAGEPGETNLGTIGLGIDEAEDD